MIDTITMTIHNTTHIPEWWRETTLARIVTFSQWFQISTDYQSEELKEWFVRFVRIVDYTNTNETPRYIENPNRCFVNMDDLVMIRYWSQTAWKIVRGISGVIANNTFQVIPQIELDKNWLFWYLKQERIYEFLNKDQSSSTMPAITFSQVGKLEILLPPLHEQRAIADMLSSLDAKIELLREQNETLDKTAQMIFHEWFGRYSVESPEELPEGWRVGKVSDFVNILSGFAFKSDDFDENGKYRLVTIANVQDGSFVESTKDGLSELPSKMPAYCNLNTGDILLSLTGNVWRICHVIWENYLLNQRVAKLKAKNETDYGYTYIYFRQNGMIGLLESISAGTAQQNLSPIKTAELESVIPARITLESFWEIINPMIKKILSNLLQIQSLSKTRNTLLPKLMSGEVRVTI